MHLVGTYRSRAKGGCSEFPRVRTQLRAPAQSDSQPSHFPVRPLRKRCCLALPALCPQWECILVPYVVLGWFHICFHPGFVLIHLESSSRLPWGEFPQAKVI